MNLNTIQEIRPAIADVGIGRDWAAGDGWLAGGTWLFSEPQPALRRLHDLRPPGWAPLTVSEAGLEIAATCTIAELFAFAPPLAWSAGALIRDCCNSFLASFKIWNAATVGGNVCMSLPAGPMISLTSALEGEALIWRRDGHEERLPIAEFVTGNHANVLQPGDLLRSILLPASALRKRFAFRRMSLTHLGRSGVLLIGTLDAATSDFLLTVTASTIRPVQIAFPNLPEPDALLAGLAEAIPDDLYHDDVHGSPAWRKHLTAIFAREIRDELAIASTINA